MKNVLLMIAAASMISGCATSTPPTGMADTPTAHETAKEGLVLAVAGAETGLDTVIDRMLWRGVYGGTNKDGCARVRLNMVDRPKHEWHYVACEGKVTEIRDVAPEPPRDHQIVAVLDGLTHAAWRTGRAQRMPYEAFELEAELVGIDGFGGCWMIEQRMLYQDMIVDVRLDRTCVGSWGGLKRQNS